MERLILFDIDGTLTRTENGYLPFNEAIFQTFTVAGDNTDQRIAKDIFTKANVEIEIGADRWQELSINLRASYRQHLERGETTVRALPGTAELLQSLSVNEAFSASVVTGNFEVTADVKLEAAGLAPYLSRGAYASDSEDRPDLPGIAKRRWEQRARRGIEPERCVIVGDTPKDLAAARQNHMKCLLVGTGRYPIEELLYGQPDGCLVDLSDTNLVLTTLANL